MFSGIFGSKHAEDKRRGGSKPKPSFDHNAPIAPEQNPPKTIEELEALILELQQKSIDIQQQLDVADSRHRQGQQIDEEWYTRTLFARRKTNQSITALQQTARRMKDKAHQAHQARFESILIKILHDKIPQAEYEEAVALAHQRAQELAAAEIAVKNSQ